MKTYMAKKGEVARRWYLMDATDKILGRMATKVATILMGKHRRSSPAKLFLAWQTYRQIV